MRLLYPSDPLDRALVDEPYREEQDAVRALGLPCSLFSFEDFELGKLRLRPVPEERYFVLDGRPFGPEGAVPDLVGEIAGRIDSPFFSVDLIASETGALRLVELGDGQVSDRKRWSAERFAAMLEAG